MGEAWDAKAFAFGALSARLSGQNLDAMRHAIDRMHPYDYLVDGYYGRWLGCVETMLVDSRVLAPGAVVARARKLRGEDVTEPPPPTPGKPDYQPTASGSVREIDTPPRFAVGDRVRTRTHAHAGHTRLPAFSENCLGLGTGPPFPARTTTRTPRSEPRHSSRSSSSRDSSTWRRS